MGGAFSLLRGGHSGIEEMELMPEGPECSYIYIYIHMYLYPYEYLYIYIYIFVFILQFMYLYHSHTHMASKVMNNANLSR